MNFFGRVRVTGWLGIALCLAIPALARAQVCLMSDEMNDATRAALENTAKRYFDMAQRGDAASIRQNAAPTLAGNFSGVETAIKDNQPGLAGAQASSSSPFLLRVEGTATLARVEFLCGVFGKNGQTANSAEFVIPDLSPGNYGVVTLNVTGAKGPRTVSFVLQQQGTDWKIGGFYVKDPQVAGHDSSWFAERARTFKGKNQTHVAWLYFLEARELAAALPFMYTQVTDRLYDESQETKPADLPVDGNTSDLVANGKTYKLTAIFPLPVNQDLDLVVKYESPDVSDRAKTFQENTAVMKAILVKFPEFKDAFDAMVVRAVEPSGRDFGSMLPMKDIK
jgi:hypothetical protein